MRKSIVLLLVLWMFSEPASCTRVFDDSIEAEFSANELNFLDNGGKILRSTNGNFELLLKHYDHGDGVYLNVAHAESNTVVWTANRNDPMTKSDVFTVTKSGAELRKKNGQVVWKASVNGAVEKLQLRDDGNLVLANGSNVLWQSFDFPTDTLLAGQRFHPGSRLISGKEDGKFEIGDYELDLQGDDVVMMWRWSDVEEERYWSLVRDDRSVQVGAPKSLAASYALLSHNAFSLFGAADSLLWQVPLPDKQDPRRAIMDSGGQFRIQAYQSEQWTDEFLAIRDACGFPSSCGPWGICMPNSPTASHCSCPQTLDFVNTTDDTQGCKAPAKPICPNSLSNTNVRSFRVLTSNVNYFANEFSFPIRTPLHTCQHLCFENCSCVAYFYNNTTETCYIYEHIGTLNYGGNYTVYVKVQPLNATEKADDDDKDNTSLFGTAFGVSAAVFSFMVITCALLMWCNIRGRNKQFKNNTIDPEDSDNEELTTLRERLPARFRYTELREATNGFSREIGSGAYGVVYEGTLPNQSKIAVKKLHSAASGKIFYSEIATIGSIHHINLVNLRGFCAEAHHRLLVYEFMSRGSLEKSLFGQINNPLTWKERYMIALGTARALEYLHSACREKIIHCDIKPENILLNEHFETKVSDFGLARLLNPEKSEPFTTMRGTRGYLAPEWLTNSVISEKADVYSYGMVMLELVSGRKNYHTPDNSCATPKSGSPAGTSYDLHYFPSYAVQMWEDGRCSELCDPRISASVEPREVEKMVKIALCCAHEDPAMRPAMGKVVLMLEGTLPVDDPEAECLQFLKMYARRFVSTVNTPTRGLVMSSNSSAVSWGSSLKIKDDSNKQSPFHDPSATAQALYSYHLDNSASVMSAAQLSGPR